MKSNQNSLGRKCGKWLMLGLCMAILAGTLCGCRTTASGNGEQSTAQTEPSAAAVQTDFPAEALESGYDAETAVRITLSDDTVAVSGTGAAAADGVLNITQAGTYLLSGTMHDGRIVVEAGKNDVVRLVFDGVSIRCADCAPLLIRQAGQVILTLADQSDNTLSDDGAYVLAETDSNVDGVIFSRSDLILNGTGTLTIAANQKHGVVSKDHLMITGGTYHVTANGHAFSGKDSVRIADGTFFLNSQTDAIQSDNAEDAALGYIYIRDGSFTIVSGTDAIQAETELTIENGTFDIQTGGGAAQAEPKISAGWNPWNTSDDAADSESAKGLKAGTALTISGGTYQLDTLDDALHTNGSAAVSGGTFVIQTGDDGIHADAALVISDGVMQIEQSYEGLEGKNVTITGGDIQIKSSDDGINAAGGSDSSNGRRTRPQDQFAENEDVFIRIQGGTVRIHASGDGVDSNGSLFIEGGTLWVDGPVSDGDSALDYENQAAVSGGTVVAVGSAGMAQTFGSTSTQCSICWTMDTAVSAGETLTLTDASGRKIVTYTPEKTWRCVVISTPELKLGETYTLSAAGQSESITLTDVSTANQAGGVFRPGGFPGGQGGSMPTPPDGQGGSMPTPPDGQGGSMPTPTDGQGGSMPTPPDGQGGTMPTPPDGQGGSRPAATGSAAEETEKTAQE